MNSTLVLLLRSLALALALSFFASTASAQYSGVPKGGLMTKGDMPAGVQPADLKKVAFEQRLDAQLPLGLPFRDESGQAVSLGQYFGHGKPVILSLVYYDCPMLCTLVLNGVAGALKGMSLKPGTDYEVVTVSFNPRDTPQLAAAKKKTYLERFNRDGAGNWWHFLTGDEAAIAQLTAAVGFHYVYDASIGQYAHASGIMIATPDGRLAKYLYGVEYAPRDVRLALVGASAGRIGNPVDQLLLYCYHYDPRTGKYGLMVVRVIRIGGVLTLAVMGSFVAVMLARDRRRSRRASAATSHNTL